jgi:hypothetical protein
MTPPKSHELEKLDKKGITTRLKMKNSRTWNICTCKILGNIEMDEITEWSKLNTQNLQNPSCLWFDA